MDEMNEELRAKELRDERGIALILAMLILLVVTLIGISAVNTTIYDNLIAGNKRASEEAFYVAEAGINEFLGRFREDATYKISDNDPTNPLWKLLLAKNLGKGATKIGYASGDPNSIQSLQSQLDFGVEVKHKVDAANQVITYSGVPIYLVKSYGYTSDGGNKVIEVELIKASSYYDPPAALYSRSDVHLLGNTYINGNDLCAGGTNKKAGIITTADTITDHTSSTEVWGIPEPEGKITNSPLNLNLKDMIDYLKGNPDLISYQNVDKVTNNNISGLVTQDWGNPTQNGDHKPLTYDATKPMNTVFFDMSNMSDKTLSMQNSYGQGILLVDGNLKVTGGFYWYGIILVTGTIDFMGSEGQGKNVTGGILSGGDTTVEIDIGGGADILYCSQVWDKIKDKIPPFKITRWRDIF